MVESMYGRFSDDLFRWRNVEEFIKNAAWREGIHAIALPNRGHFDVLLRGDIGSWESTTSLPVFFSGAVQRDGTQPPFFSGSNLAREKGLPLVSIADPTLNLSESLGIGWYTGGAKMGFQQALTQFLCALHATFPRGITLVGGSAGGFASLYYASRVQCGAFVWNPQVDLLRYGSWAVRQYLEAALDDTSWRSNTDVPINEVTPIAYDAALAALREAGIDSSAGPSSTISRLLYLQNQSDQHLQLHAEPYYKENSFYEAGNGLYLADNAAILVGNFSAGHRAPGRETIISGLNLAINGTSNLADGARRILAD